MPNTWAGRGFDFDVEGLALDMFELADNGLEVESLTTDHGLPEVGASQSIYACSGGGCREVAVAP